MIMIMIITINKMNLSVNGEINKPWSNINCNNNFNENDFVIYENIKVSFLL